MTTTKCYACGSNRLYIVRNHFVRCKDCKSIFIARLENEKDYREKIVEHYTTIDPIENVAASRRGIYDRFLRRIQPYHTKDATLLDIGCGRGDFLYLAKNKYKWNVTGIEPCKKVAKIGREKFGLNIYPVFFEEASFPENSFDIITAWDVLDDIFPVPNKMIEKIYQILKPGGLFFLRIRNVVFHYVMYRVVEFFKKVKLAKLFPCQVYVFHAANFSGVGVAKLLKGYGFRNVQVLNSTLTVGDPYNVNHFGFLFKRMVYPLAQILYYLSAKKCLLSPSLFVFANK